MTGSKMCANNNNIPPVSTVDIAPVLFFAFQNGGLNLDDIMFFSWCALYGELDDKDFQRHEENKLV